LRWTAPAPEKVVYVQHVKTSPCQNESDLTVGPSAASSAGGLAGRWRRLYFVVFRKKKV
jgi:hypothetical protein